MFTPTPPLGQIAFGAAAGIPPQQKLASALIVYPYVVHSGNKDTRIQLVNLSAQNIQVRCFYVRQEDCVEIGFFLSLTAEQPMAWLASEGARNELTFSAVPPFDGTGELKCAVDPQRPEIEAHNAIQGRATVFDRVTGQTVGYGADGFLRLVPGSFPGIVELDGFTYEECPERLHFQVLASHTVNSELVLVPCSQDLLTQVPTETVVQMAIVNEFEQVFSSSTRLRCHTRLSFSRFGTLQRAVLGSDTAHLILRGVSSPVLGLVVDRFDALGVRHTTVNEPFLEGGAPATVIFP